MAPKPHRPSAAPFEWQTLNERQLELKHAIETHEVVFAIGPAGTGKTLVSTYMALDYLTKGVKGGGVSKLMVSRPLKTVGRELGFMPGDLKAKIDPYLRPVYDIIRSSDHPDTQSFLDPAGPLEGIAVELMRGMTISDTYFILDEAQNVDRAQMEMVLSRLGHNAKIVVAGDPSQCDLKEGQSGLIHAVRLFCDNAHCAIVEFTADDVVRSGFVGDVIRAYDLDRTAYLRSQHKLKGKRNEPTLDTQ